MGIETGTAAQTTTGNGSAAGPSSQQSATLRPTQRPDGKFDPVPAYAFHIEIDGIVEASFTACTGLSVTRDVTPLREGGMNDGVHWIHSGLSYGKITLESGVTHSDALWQWFITGAADGKITYKNFFILQMVPYTDKIARRYSIEKGFPTTWTGPGLNTGSADAAVETLEIAFTRFALATE